MIFRALSGVLLGTGLMLAAAPAEAQNKQLTIATGGTGGVYYPLAGGFGSIIAKEIPGYTATAEVTGGSVDNMRLIGAGNADLCFTQVDTAVDAVNGRDKFTKKINVRALVVMYPNLMQVISIDGTGVTKFEDMKGRRVSTGAPGSGTEIFALRLIEAAGLDKDKDMKRERLSAAESANALKDKKVDAFLFVAGAPTSAITDVAASPGVKMVMIDHAHLVGKIVAKYGPVYSTGTIPKGVYPNQDKDNQVAAVWNIMAVRDDFSEDLAYKLTKLMLEKREDLGKVHKEALNIKASDQKSKNAGIPWHPGALKYFAEKGIKVD
ncbi:MAG: TAXI family TRAP transporter solute-binding subunit [Hyphomicrobiaceae bacterium]|nr:TAXI family TRAP transporter solute-binding subunit [Hyphomicrobiaceae bacterium]